MFFFYIFHGIFKAIKSLINLINLNARGVSEVCVNKESVAIIQIYDPAGNFVADEESLCK